MASPPSTSTVAVISTAAAAAVNWAKVNQIMAQVCAANQTARNLASTSAAAVIVAADKALIDCSAALLHLLLSSFVCRT